MIDIYFEPKYGELYESVENGKCEVFKHNSTHGKIQHIFIKRKIPLKINNDVYYDLVTPYGYGGPVILEYKPGYKNELLKEFTDDFKQYCINNNIVSEFIRFHPIIKNHSDFKNIYNISYIRNTVATSITKNEDPMNTEFSKSARKSIRRALRSGVKYEVIEKPSIKDINYFLDIYYSTMDRNNASNYYYFDKEYFHQCMKHLGDNILLIKVLYEDNIISMGFYFVYKDMIHAHLSGTLSKYLKLSPAYIIKYATAQWAKENNITLIHYGGGTSNSKEDPLYKFKKKFSKNTEFEFYIGRKIWNTDVYHELCQIKNVDENISFFPAYRYKAQD